MCRVDEFAGLTLATIPKTVRSATIVPPYYHNFLTNKDMFYKYMFDLLYGCHVLHKRVGVIHLDLHLNNMTIMEVDNSFYDTHIKVGKGIDKITYNRDKESFISYILDGQKETYIFPYDGYCGTLIDFSDSVLSERFLLFANKFIEKYNFKDMVQYEQDYIYEKLSSALSYVGRNEKKIRAALITDFELMFKAITAIDFVSITRNLRMTFEKELEKPKDMEHLRKFYVESFVLDALKDMEDTSLEFLLSNMQRVVSGDTDKVEFVGDVLLPKFFSNYMYLKWDKSRLSNGIIHEVYSFNAPWKYSCAKQEHYPPWAQKDIVIKKFGQETANELIGAGTISKSFERDVHLAFIIESLGSKYNIGSTRYYTNDDNQRTIV
jgi:hypothetical protein